MDMSYMGLWKSMSGGAKAVVIVMFIMSIYSIWVMVERFITFNQAKNPPADVNEKRDIIEKGKAALQHAIDLRPDYFESVVYLNLLWRQQALTEADPVKAQADIAQAEALKNRAIEINKQKKAAAAAKKT